MSSENATYLLRDLEPQAAEFYRRMGEGKLMTTRCPSCEETSFPPRLACRQCGGRTEWVEIDSQGTLEAFTTQESSLRFSSPTVLALVRLGPVVLPGIIEEPIEDLRIDQLVRAELFPDPDTDLTLLRFRSSS